MVQTEKRMDLFYLALKISWKLALVTTSAYAEEAVRSSFSVKVKTLLDDETAFLPEISPSVLIACSEFAEGDGIEAPHGSPAKAAMGHLITVFQEA